MKEVDFLPEWYKSGRRRQVNYRTQYIALGAVFMAMMMWNFIATNSISRATAELAQDESKVSVAESASREFASIKDEVTKLQKRAKSIEEIDSKIDVANVLAEMSFLIDEKIVLRKVQFSAEKFVDSRGAGQSHRPDAAVRVAGGNSAGKQTLSLGDVRFKVVINGVAADASDVAELICQLEDSSYFCQVVPSFSRNTKIVPARAGVRTAAKLAEENFRVSEFEISCYLANYAEN